MQYVVAFQQVYINDAIWLFSSNKFMWMMQYMVVFLQQVYVNDAICGCFRPTSLYKWCNMWSFSIEIISKNINTFLTLYYWGSLLQEVACDNSFSRLSWATLPIIYYFIFNAEHARLLIMMVWSLIYGIYTSFIKALIDLPNFKPLHTFSFETI